MQHAFGVAQLEWRASPCLRCREEERLQKAGQAVVPEDEKAMGPQVPPEFAGRGVQERIGKVIEAVELNALTGNRGRRARLSGAH